MANIHLFCCVRVSHINKILRSFVLLKFINVNTPLQLNMLCSLWKSVCNGVIMVAELTQQN